MQKMSMYRKILVVLDERGEQHIAVHESVLLAQAHNAALLFLYLLADVDVASLDIAPVTMALQSAHSRTQHARAKEVLHRAAMLAEQCGVLSRSIVGHRESHLDFVLELAKQRRCDLIVVEADQSNAVQRLFNGSLIPGLISRSPVPVLVCRDSTVPRAANRRSLQAIQARERRMARREMRREERND